MRMETLDVMGTSGRDKGNITGRMETASSLPLAGMCKQCIDRDMWHFPQGTVLKVADQSCRGESPCLQEISGPQGTTLRLQNSTGLIREL